MDELKGKDVLVTGGNGFIGSHLTRKLLKEGANVSVIIKGDDKNIKDILNKLNVYDIDITNLKDVKEVVNKVKPKKIFNIAATTDIERSFDIINKVIDINIKGSLNVVRALNKIKYDCLINVGTIEEYGVSKAPFKEDFTIPEPVSPYSASKSSLVMFSKMLYNSFKLPIVVLRLAKVYGPYETVNLDLNKSLIPKLILCGLLKKKFKLSGGEQYRDFVYIDDVVEGFIKASINKKAIGNIINLGSGKGYVINDIVKKIVDIIGEIKIDSSQPYRKGENMVFYNDNKKAKKLLNWEPKVVLDKGLTETINWYKTMYEKGELEKWIIQKKD